MTWEQFLEAIDAFLAQQLYVSRAGTLWTAGDLMTAAGFLLGALLASWIVRFLFRRFAHTDGNAHGNAPGTAGHDADAPDVLERVFRALLLLSGVVLALEAVHLYPHGLLDIRLFEISNVRVTVTSVLVAFGVVLTSFLVSRLLRGGVHRWLSADSPQSQANVRAFSRLVHYVVVLIGIVIALPTLGIEIGALVAVGGVFVVALGFAMKELTENFVSGVILLAERVIKPGDVLEVDGTIVQVSQMGIRTTMAKSRDGEDLIIPNSLLVSSTVKNLTWRDADFRIHVPVGVSYDSDLKVVFEALGACAERFPERVSDHRPQVNLVGFGSSSVDFDVIVWIADPWRMRKASSDLHAAVWWALKDAGVTIAYPQLDVHLDERGLAAVASRVK